MIEIYKGDTFPFTYYCEMKNGHKYTIPKGAELHVFIVSPYNNKVIHKLIEIEKDSTDIDIVIDSEQMKECVVGGNILEIKVLVDGAVFTTTQQSIRIKESELI